MGDKNRCCVQCQTSPGSPHLLLGSQHRVSEGRRLLHPALVSIYGHGRFHWTSGMMAQHSRPPAGVNELLNLVLGAEKSQIPQQDQLGLPKAVSVHLQPNLTPNPILPAMFCKSCSHLFFSDSPVNTPSSSLSPRGISVCFIQWCQEREFSQTDFTRSRKKSLAHLHHLTLNFRLTLLVYN